MNIVPLAIFGYQIDWTAFFVTLPLYIGYGLGIALIIAVYWIICWYLPKEESDNPVRAIIIAHLIVFFIIWAICAYVYANTHPVGDIFTKIPLN